MKVENIKQLGNSDATRDYVGFGRIDNDDSCLFSKGGKAILVETPEHGHHEVWIPVSICRLQSDTKWGHTLLVPVWFCMNEGIRY